MTPCALCPYKVRRLCLDEHRYRYGRRQSSAAGVADQHVARRRLADWLGIDPDVAGVAAPDADGADTGIRALELSSALEAAVARLDVSDRFLLRHRWSISVASVT